MVIALVLMAVPVTVDAAFDPIPDDADFVPMLCDGEPAWDPVGDDQGRWRDIVGDEERDYEIEISTTDEAGNTSEVSREFTGGYDFTVTGGSVACAITSGGNTPWNELLILFALVAMTAVVRRRRRG